MTFGAQQEALRRLDVHIRKHCRPQDRLPPIRVLARQLDIGVVSVNKAVQELARQGVLVSRSGLGTYVNTMPAEDTAASISQDQTRQTSLALQGRTVSIVSTWDDDEMVRSMARIVGDKVIAQGGSVNQVHNEPRQCPNKTAAMQDSNGLVVINPNASPDMQPRPGQALLIIKTAVESPVTPGAQYDEVSVDQEHAAALAGLCLREAGCRRVCFLGVHPLNQPDVYSRTSQIRLEAFERGWKERVPDQYLLRCTSFGESWGARLVAPFAQLSPRPDAVFAASDELAVGFIKASVVLGLEAGRDYQIVGFDGQQRGKMLPEGPLTTVQAPVELMANRGAELLIDRMLHPDQPTRRVQLGCTLFRGKTCVTGNIAMKE